MPNLPMHIHLASRVAKRLDWDWLNDHAGSLFLGSTAPDMRAMTKWPRERTHFAPLSSDEIGTGPRNMFRLHPELANHNGESSASRAFLVGYISHLVADEAWIANIYRPNFDPPAGNEMAAGTEVEAQIWDRALQLEMDREALPEMDNLLRGGEVLAAADVEIDLGFLEPGSLNEWREWVSRLLGWEFTWDRLKRALNRMYRDDDGVQVLVDNFIRDMPASLERIYEKIPREHIDSYQRLALEETLIQVHERLGQTHHQPDLTLE